MKDYPVRARVRLLLASANGGAVFHSLFLLPPVEADGESCHKTILWIIALILIAAAVLFVAGIIRRV